MSGDESKPPPPEETRRTPPALRSAAPAKQRQTATSRRSRKRRQRLVISGVIVTFVLVFGWIGVIVLLQALSSGGEKSFREETQAMLEALRAGQAGEIYEQAAPQLQSKTTRERFLDVATDIETNLGAYQEILNIEVAERISGPGGRTARVNVTLSFDRGRVNGNFSYHEDSNGVWRLLGFGLGMPQAPEGAAIDQLDAGADAAAPTLWQEPHIPAPEAVMEQVEQIMSLTREGRYGAIYDAGASTLKSGVPRARFEAILAKRVAVLGKLVSVVEVIDAKQNRSRDEASVKLQVQFARTDTTVALGFIRLDNHWALTEYQLAIPSPSIPSVSASPEF